MADPCAGQILEATLTTCGDTHRIVVVAVCPDGRVRARRIGVRNSDSGEWDASLGQVATWDLSRHDWREV